MDDLEKIPVTLFIKIILANIVNPTIITLNLNPDD